MKGILKTVVVFMALCLLSSGIRSQSIWMAQPKGNAFSIEILKPDFELSDDFTFLTSVIFLNGQFQLSERASLLVELPISHAAVDYDDEFNNDDESETAVGNPYLAINFIKPGTMVKTELGIRLPVTSDNKYLAAPVGVFTDPDRMEAFIPDMVIVHLRLDSKHKSPSNFATRFRLGTTLWVDTNNSLEDDLELLVDYSGQLGYADAKKSILFGLSGRMVATESGDLGSGRFIIWAHV